MATPAVLTLRKAQEEDRGRLANLLHFEAHVHRHLDWRHALDWLGRHPFLVAENSGRLGAALACPPDPPSIAWLRLFAVSARTTPSEAWKVLWPAAEEQLAEKVNQVVAIPLYGWFNELLSASQFEHVHNVVVLEWEPEFEKSLLNQGEQVADVRAMRNEDLASVLAVDNGGFPPLWQHSLETIQMAFAHCSNATIIEVEGEVAAYQISTISGQGLHLARLAVHPKWQGKHFAQSLVHKLQSEVGQLQKQRLTVNTQDINKPSLALYEKAGFKFTNESFPVYQLEISK
jgi:ribosomal protein S18 acetylase RimI-like enzyme